MFEKEQHVKILKKKFQHQIEKYVIYELKKIYNWENTEILNNVKLEILI